MRGVAGRGPMIRPWSNRQTPLRVGRYLSTLAAQFLQTGSDRHEIVSGTGSDHTFPPIVLPETKELVNFQQNDFGYPRRSQCQITTWFDENSRIISRYSNCSNLCTLLNLLPCRPTRF